MDSTLHEKGDRVATINQARDVLSSESIDRSVSTKQPKDPYAKILQEASVLCFRGKVSEGLSILRSKAVKKGKFPASAWTAIGNCYFRQGKTDLAELHYYKALEVNRRYIPALNNLGVIEIEQGKTPDAFLRFKEIAESSQKLVPKWNLARLYLRSFHFDRARELLEELRTRPVKDPDLLVGMGVAQYHLGNYRLSEKLFEDAETHRSEKASYLLNFGLVLKKRRRFDQLLYVSKRALSRIDKNTPPEERVEQKKMANEMIALAQSELQKKAREPAGAESKKEKVEVNSSGVEDIEDIL